MKLILALIATAALAGCASPYKADGALGGYSEVQLDKNIFKVSFRGNGYTRPQQAEEMALMRSAELTLQHGYRYFVVVGSSASANHSTITTPTYAQTTATSYGNTVRANTVVTGGQSFLVSMPSSSNTIVCLEERPEGVMSFDAQYVFKSLSAKYLKN